MDAGLLRVQSRMDKENVAEMKEMLSHYSPSLHPHHALLTETKQHLAAALAPRAENAKINVTDEPYFGTQIVCNYLPFSKAAKGAQGGPQQYATFERKHSPTEK